MTLTTHHIEFSASAVTPLDLDAQARRRTFASCWTPGRWTGADRSAMRASLIVMRVSLIMIAVSSIVSAVSSIMIAVSSIVIAVSLIVSHHNRP
jgi:hypothetical protein